MSDQEQTPPTAEETPPTAEETPVSKETPTESEGAAAAEDKPEETKPEATPEETKSEDKSEEENKPDDDKPAAEAETKQEEPSAEDKPAEEAKPAGDEDKGDAGAEAGAVGGGGDASTEDKPKEEEGKKKSKSKEKPPKVVKPPPDYRSTMTGFVEKKGSLLKKWNRFFMSLDEEGSVLRWWKSEERKSTDSAIYMKFCVGVAEPNDEVTTNWPDNTDDRCFIIRTNKRDIFLVADTPENRTGWIEKLKEAKETYASGETEEKLSQPGFLGRLKASFKKSPNQRSKQDEKKDAVAEETPAAATEGAEGGEPKTEETVTVVVEVGDDTPAEPKADEPPPENKEGPSEGDSGATGEEAPAKKDEPPTEDDKKDEPPTEDDKKDEPPTEDKKDADDKKDEPAEGDGGDPKE